MGLPTVGMFLENGSAPEFPSAPASSLSMTEHEWSLNIATLCWQHCVEWAHRGMGVRPPPLLASGNTSLGCSLRKANDFPPHDSRPSLPPPSDSFGSACSPGPGPGESTQSVSMPDEEDPTDLFSELKLVTLDCGLFWSSGVLTVCASAAFMHCSVWEPSAPGALGLLWCCDVVESLWSSGVVTWRLRLTSLWGCGVVVSLWCRDFVSSLWPSAGVSGGHGPTPMWSGGVGVSLLCGVMPLTGSGVVMSLLRRDIAESPR